MALESSIMIRKTTEQFIKDAIKIHGNKFDYSLVEYKGVKNKIKIKCSENHVFEQTPNDHLNGHGCKICSGWGVLQVPKNLNPKKRHSPKEFISRARKIHGNKYNYDKSIYDKWELPLVITCKKHGDFIMTPSVHLSRGAGCQKCGMEISSEKRRWTKEIFLEKAKDIHGDLYNYDEIEFKNANYKIGIKCVKHGCFYQFPKDHINNKQGCPSCCFSKGEIAIEKYLKENNINFIPQHTFENCKDKRKLPFDFYLPNHNTVIEFHGEQHYNKVEYFEKRSGGLEGIKKRDNLKKEFCKLNNISYIEISYKNKNNIYKILNKLNKKYEI